MRRGVRRFLVRVPASALRLDDDDDEGRDGGDLRRRGSDRQRFWGSGCQSLASSLAAAAPSGAAAYVEGWISEAGRRRDDPYLIVRPIHGRYGDGGNG